MEVAAAAGAGKVVLNCLLSGAKATIGADDASKKLIRRDLPFLKEELEAMQLFVINANLEQNKHKVDTAKVTRARTLVYDVDDCIQEATVQLAKPSRWQLPHTMQERQRIADEMISLRARIEGARPRNLRYHIAEDPNSGSSRAGGSNKPGVNLMVRQINNNQGNDLKVIAVWGTSSNLEQMSILRAAYENPAVQEKFPCRAWVRVMLPFNPIEFVQGLVRQFHKAGEVDVLLEAEKPAQQLVEEFNKHVRENRYLIVLNDLNTIEEWDRIKTCFPNNNKGSRIIVSTKQAEVATLSVGYESVQLKIKELAPDQILYAFREKASEKKDGDAPEISKVALLTCPSMSLSGKSYLVGRAKEKSHIIKLITCERSKPVIFVWGMRGIGKTTLVRDIYDSVTFRMRAYVTVVHPFNREELFKSLAMQLIAGRAYKDKNMVARWRGKTLTPEQLIEMLDALLDGIKCLIVFVDVLSAEEWQTIVTPFGHIRNSTKIIATTREEIIAYNCTCSRETMYELEPLEHEDGLDLFTRKVFGGTKYLEQDYSELDEQANMIVRKCNGLPLAIVAVGALLANQQRTEFEWSKLNELITDRLDNSRSIFRIGYDYLPYHFKTFMLYLPIFPEDCKVRRRRLIRRWAAEGYSWEVRNKSAEETADIIFRDLISRSIILPCPLSVDTREGIDSCQVPGLTSELAISKSSEENLVFKLEPECIKITKGTVRHLVVRSNWEGAQSELMNKKDISRLRSLTVFGKWRPFIRLGKMRLLRVLDLEDTLGLVDHHLEQIGKLLHLRYLSLRGCGDIYHLPDSLGNLRLLETLDIKGTKITKLPKTTNKLINLQHVVAGYAGDGDLDESMSVSVPKPMRNKLGRMAVFSAGFCVACCAPHRMKQKMDIDGDVNRRDVCTICCCAMLPAVAKRRSAGGVAVPRGINKLKALLTLGTVNVSGRRRTALQDIKEFTRLRKLGVAGINRRNSQELCSTITHLGCLESLSVRSDGELGLVGCFDGMTSPPEKLQSLKLYGMLVRLPFWIWELSNLVKLKLGGSRLNQSDDDVARVLGSLPKLAILGLLENSFEGEQVHLNFGAKSFRTLLVLQLQSLDGFRRVGFQQGATPRLEVLTLGVSSGGDCRFYGLEHLPSLREVVLSNQGRAQEHMTEDMLEQLAMNPNRPVLRMGN